MATRWSSIRSDWDDQGPLDRYRTPHTKSCIVVERYHLNGGGKGIEITFTVEDPGASPCRGREVDFRWNSPALDHWEETSAPTMAMATARPDQLVPDAARRRPDF